MLNSLSEMLDGLRENQEAQSACEPKEQPQPIRNKSYEDTVTVQLVFYTPEAEMAETRKYAETRGAAYNAERNYYANTNKLSSTWCAPTLIVDNHEGLMKFSDEIRAPTAAEVCEVMKRVEREGVPRRRKPKNSADPLQYENRDTSWRCPGMMCGSMPDMVPYSIETKYGGEYDRYYKRYDRRYEEEEEEEDFPPADGIHEHLIGSNRNGFRGSFTPNLSRTDAFEYPDGFVELADSLVEWRSPDRTTKYLRPVCCHVELILPCPEDPSVFNTYYIRQGTRLTKIKNKNYVSKIKNVYTILNLSITEEAYRTLIEYCESMVGVLEFNWWGLVLNHALPGPAKTVASWFYSNGASYVDAKAAYCSEFITRAFCKIGVFKDANEIGSSVSVASTVVDDVVATDEPAPADPNPSGTISIVDLMKIYKKEQSVGPKYKCVLESKWVLNETTKEVSVDPATMSPNWLFVYLWLKEYSYMVGEGVGYPVYPADQAYRGLSYGTLPEKKRKRTG